MEQSRVVNEEWHLHVWDLCGLDILPQSTALSRVSINQFLIIRLLAQERAGNSAKIVAIVSRKQELNRRSIVMNTHHLVLTGLVSCSAGFEVERVRRTQQQKAVRRPRRPHRPRKLIGGSGTEGRRIFQSSQRAQEAGIDCFVERTSLGDVIDQVRRKDVLVYVFG